MANTLYDYYTAQGRKLPSVSERAEIYGAAGLGSGYAGTAEQNTALLSYLQKAPSKADPIPLGAASPAVGSPAPLQPQPTLAQKYTSPSGIASSDPIRTAEAKEKSDKIEADRKQQEELLRLTTQKSIQDLRAEVSPGPAPTAPDLTGEYDRLRTEGGVVGIEQEISDITKRKMQLRNELQEFKNRTSGQGIVSSVVEGSIADKANKLQEEYDRLTTEEAVAVDRLNAKNSYIESVMNLTGQEYSNALAQYDKEFSRNQQLQAQLSTDQNRVRDDSRAYLTTVSNFMSENGQTFADLDPGMQAEIRRQELQAGLPIGTIEAFAVANPKAKLLATKEGVDASGQNVVSFIYEDENGMPDIIRTVGLGTRSATEAGGLTQAQMLSQVGRIADDVRSDPDVKNFVDIRDGYERVTTGAGLDNAQGDLALLFGYMKILDPTSVVRETEFDNAQAAMGFAQRVLNIPANLIKGDRLTKDGRKQFETAAKSLYNAKKTNYDSAINFYTNQAETLGVDPGLVLRDFSSQAGKQFQPGDTVEDNGIIYLVGEDGETVTPIASAMK